ncbi:MAG TPA: hypothetical protein VI451_14580 [Anaerolineales bacterium]|nr:hypothetical protein [Anaerolineales bacterium]
MKSRLLFAFAAILWLAVVTGFYYLTHKPFTLEIARSLSLAAWRIAIAGAILSVAGGLGRRILPQPGKAPLFWLSAHAALGLGILGTGILLTGLTFGFNRWFFGILLVALIILLYRDIVNWWVLWRDFPKLWHLGGRLGRIIGLGCILLLGFPLLTALAPPFMFDALVYHLTLPKVYLSAGRIDYQPWLIFWGMPQMIEMLFTWAISLGGIETASILNWGIGVLTLVGLVSWTASRISPRAGWVAAASLLSGFSLVISLGWGYVEWLMMLFGLVTLILLDMWSTGNERKFLLLTGLCTGFAIGTKYTAGVLAICGMGVIFWHFRRVWQNGAIEILWFVFPIFLAVIPWLIKNYLFTDNPFYPLLFPAGAMNEVRLEIYQNQLVFGDWRDAVFLPWQATMFGVHGGDGYSISMGPLLLGFSALGWVGWQKRQKMAKRTLAVAAIFTIIGIVFWAISGRLTFYAIQTRMHMAIFPAIAILSGAGFEGLEWIKLPGVRFGRLAAVVLLLVFGFNLLEVSEYSLRQDALQHLLGLSKPEEYLNGNLGMTNLAFKAINELPEDARVLTLWEPRSLYCTPRCIPDEIVDRWLADRAEYGTSDAILASWRAAGYTHVMVYHTGVNFYWDDPLYQIEDWQTLTDLLASLPVQTDLNQIYTLYALAP